MPTPVVLGSTRELWFANVTDTNPQWSFLEDPVGTTKTSGGLGRSQRIGDPIDTGPNSTWTQLTFQGGEGQDVWSDKQMYQYGEVDVLSYTGKAKMWPGLQSWWKNDTSGSAMGAVMCEGSASSVDWSITPLYMGQSDNHPGEQRAGAYLLYRFKYTAPNPNHNQIETLHYWNEPYRILAAVQGDDYSDGWIMFCTATHMFTMFESNPASSRIFEDTNAPATGTQKFEYCRNTVAAFNGAIYYGHGNRLWKRVPKPPYGTLGTHTLIKAIPAALHLAGMTVWNNRVYFGVNFGNGKSEVMVTDGATTVKAFEFPHQFRAHKMVSHAGALYILGYTYSGGYPAGGGGAKIQQVYRYDGRALKLLWKQGVPGDNAYHWPSDLIVHDGYIVWARQGTMELAVGIGTNVDNNKARLVFYDPVNDAIVGGPGLARENSNVGRPDNDSFGTGLWITGLSNWNNTIAVHFKDITSYTFKTYGPSLLAIVKPEDYVTNDFTYPHSGDVAQFDASTGFCRQFLQSSEYHGPDDVGLNMKTWLSYRMRLKCTGPNVGVDIYMIDPDTNITTKVGTHTAATLGTNNWKNVIVPLKKADGTYQISSKIQFRFEMFSTNVAPGGKENVWVDDIAVQYSINPQVVRQWNIRVPLSDAQLTLHTSNAPNSLATADALAQKLEDLYFTGVPVKFWEPSASGSVPAPGTPIEVRIISFQRHQARLADNETGLVGSVAMTLVENVLV